MELFRTFYLLYLAAAFVKCAPTENQSTFYDIILQKCPNIATWQDYKNISLFRTCHDWEKIIQTQKLTENTKYNVLCLLYYASFTQNCSQVKPPMNTISNLDLHTICDNLDIIPKQIGPDDALHQIITTKEDCMRLCDDEFGSVHSMCAISYYYSHFLEYSPAKKSHNHMLAVPQAQQYMLSVTNKQNPPTPKQEQEQLNPHPATAPEQPNVKEPITQQRKPVQSVVNAKAPVKPDVAGQLPDDDQNPPPGLAEGASSVKPSTEGAKKPSTEGAKKLDTLIANPEEKSATKVKSTTEEEKKVEPPPKPVKPPALPKDEETIPLDKNTDKVVEETEDFDHVGDDTNQIDESEENMENPSNLMDKSQQPKQVIDPSDAVNFTTEVDGDSYFFTYFMLLCVIFIVGYVCYHNKQKILALILEGRRGKRQYRGRRPNSANYHKLDSNLEEAITSSCNKNTNNVIY